MSTESGEWWQCKKCPKILTTKRTLRDHYLRKHQWLLDEDCPASPTTIRDMKKKEEDRRKKPTLKEGKTQKDTMSNDGSRRDTAISVADEDEEDVEPSSDNETIKDPRTKTGEEKTPMDLKVANWSTTPHPVSDDKNPCEKRKLELSQPTTSVKEHLAAKGIFPPKTGGSGDGIPPAPPKIPALQLSAKPPKPSTSSENPGDSGIVLAVPTTHSLQPLTRSELALITDLWPERDRTPSVRDVIGFRRSVPQTMSPAQISELAAARFGWNLEATVTSERYIQGVVAAHDVTKRALIDEVRRMLADRPTDPTVAMHRWGALEEWAHSLQRPPTPDQPFDD